MTRLKWHWIGTLCLGLGTAMVLSGCDNSGGASNVEAVQASASNQKTSGENASDSADAASNMADSDDSSDAASGSDSRSDGRASADDRATTPGDDTASGDSDRPSLRDRLNDRQDRAKGDMATGDRRAPADNPLTVRAEPESLDLGKIATGDSGHAKVRLYNEGEEPVTLVNCRTSCGCTTTNCPRGESIKPGESVEVEVSLKGGRSATTINKTVTFQLEGQRPLIVPVRAEAVEYVTVKPNYMLDKKESGETELVVESTDENPLRITRMHPAVIESFPEEPQQSVTLNFPWERWQELGEPTIVRMDIEHPKATELQLIVKKTRRRDPTRTSDGSLDPKSKSGEALSPARTKPAVEVLIKRGEHDALMARIEEGLDLETRDNQGNTILALAARYGTPDLVTKLIEAGANVEGRANNGQTPLMQAARSKNTEIVKLLLEKGASIDTTDRIGNTALSWAAGFGDAATTKTLIDAGADVNVAGGATGWSPLIWAAKLNDPEVVKTLIDAGADLEQTGNLWAATALVHAAQTGEDENIKVLLEHGAKLESTDRMGRTALLMAAGASGAKASTVQALIDAGADLTATDSKGRNALEIAKAERTDPRRQEVIAVLEKVIDSGDEASDDEADSGS